MDATCEADRLATLHACRILDTDPEPDFDTLVELAAETTDAPIALISLVDEKRQWFKARVGIEETETPREVSFCSHCILRDEIMVVEDARLDPRFADNPFVVSEPGVRFYAGIPLAAGNGRHNVGTLCIVDMRPRRASRKIVRVLKALHRHAEAQIDRRYQTHLLDDLQREMQIMAGEINFALKGVARDLGCLLRELETGATDAARCRAESLSRSVEAALAAPVSLG